MLLVYLIPLAVLAGYLGHGALRNYALHPLRLVLLPCLAFAVEALLPRFPDALAAMVCLEYALLLLFCAANLRAWPLWLLTAGVLMNFSVIAANGFRMPVSQIALDVPALQATAARIQSGELLEYVIAAEDAPLYFLGDVLYLPFLPNGLASLGDFVLGAGVFALIPYLMKGNATPCDTESPSATTQPPTPAQSRTS